MINECQTDLEFRIATNLGNIFNFIGRFSEAIEYWDKALEKCPDYAMAQGNKGFALCQYARILYDDGHQGIFLWQARRDLTKALDGNLEGGASESFRETIQYINSILKVSDNCSPFDEYKLGNSEQEINYREWVLENRLFLNPLNDLGNKSIAARDVFCLPSIVVDRGESPELYGLYNQIKQEFVSARFLFYQSIKNKDSETHYSDKEVLLFDTLDYPKYGLNIEKVKMAFLNSYAILDKIAFLLNHYFKLKIPDQNTSFRNVWYVQKNKRKELRPYFAESKNWPLRGLFWLSKDFYEKDVGFIGSIEPAGKELSSIRNHIAHKYLKVHDEHLWGGDGHPDRLFIDGLSYSIRRDQLEFKTLKLLKLVRNALIYSSLGIHFNESFVKEKPERGLIAHMSLHTYDDKFKD